MLAIKERESEFMNDYRANQCARPNTVEHDRLAPLPKRRSEIAEAMNGLEEIISMMDETVNIINDRLSPVSRVPNPTPIGVQPPSNEQVPLAAGINNQADRIRRINGFLADLNDRIEL